MDRGRRTHCESEAELDKGSDSRACSTIRLNADLGVVFNRTPFLRKVFYRLLDLLLLRAWHIQRELRQWATDKTRP